MKTINRTIFGIETHKSKKCCWINISINRTIFGIETKQIKLLINSITLSINRTIFGIET